MEFLKILEVWGTGGPSSLPIKKNTDKREKGKVFYSPESRTLQQCKGEINLFYQEGKWDDYKKITNPYEYIFLSWNRRSSRSVATRQPLSRSYFKMIELWKRLDLTNEFRKLLKPGQGVCTAHAAEGPGGFIEACATMLDRDTLSFESAIAITLRSDVKNVPGWRKASRFLEQYPQVSIHDGADGTGNILLEQNQDAYVQSVRTKYPEGVHFFTADGGFDFSNDYNAQEDSVFPLLLAESILGLRVLMKGGICIIKCFDTFEQPTHDLLWLLSRAFCQWAIMKPRTSRAGNAERYFVGKGFLGNIDDILQVLIEYQREANFPIPILETPVLCESWKSMILQIISLQEIIEHVEIIVIRQTLDLIQSSNANDIKNFVHANVIRSIEWCREHGEEISMSWLTEQDRNVSKETTDLLHILHQNTSTTYPNWISRSTVTTQVSFEGFRTGIVTPIPTSSNPFMRIKGKNQLAYRPV